MILRSTVSNGGVHSVERGLKGKMVGTSISARRIHSRQQTDKGTNREAAKVKNYVKGEPTVTTGRQAHVGSCMYKM